VALDRKVTQPVVTEVEGVKRTAIQRAHDRFWPDTRPNLRREMEERKRRFQDKEDVFLNVRERVQRGFTSGVFGGIYVLTDSGEVPDDLAVRLVVKRQDVVV